jgi:hypothetical protein
MEGYFSSFEYSYTTIYTYTPYNFIILFYKIGGYLGLLILLRVFLSYCNWFWYEYNLRNRFNELRKDKGLETQPFISCNREEEEDETFRDRYSYEKIDELCQRLDNIEQMLTGVQDKEKVF